MRIIVYGLGAVGGSIAAAATRAGTEVIGIARGRMLEAIRADGLLFRTPAGDERIRFPVVGTPSEIDFRPDDAILLTMKSQDTAGAIAALVEAGVSEQPVFCFQNGLNNERLALRHFANVYGVTVMIPADYTVPGEVAGWTPTALRSSARAQSLPREARRRLRQQVLELEANLGEVGSWYNALTQAALFQLGDQVMQEVEAFRPSESLLPRSGRRDARGADG